MESGCVESIYISYTQCVLPDSDPTILLYHPKRKPRRVGGLSLYRSVFKKRRPLGFGVFVVIWSMVVGSQDSQVKLGQSVPSCRLSPTKAV
jgi:hypothetical protein